MPDFTAVEKQAVDLALEYFKKIAMELYKGVTQKTPVDTGHLRGNWQVFANSPKTNTVSRKIKVNGLPEAKTINSLTASKFTGLQKIFIANNLPYASVIEEGKYPSSPKKGSYLKAGQTKHGATGAGWFKFSMGGYSKQAPNGMARITIKEILG